VSYSSTALHDTHTHWHCTDQCHTAARHCTTYTHTGTALISVIQQHCTARHTHTHIGTVRIIHGIQHSAALHCTAGHTHTLALYGSSVAYSIQQHCTALHDTHTHWHCMDHPWHTAFSSTALHCMTHTHTHTHIGTARIIHGIQHSAALQVTA